MKRVLITGGTGFVGANLARRLLKGGHEVGLIVRKDFKPWRIEEIKNDVRLHEANLGDEKTLSTLVDKIKPEWIFHLAVYGAYHWQTDIHKMVETNITGTINLVNACLKTGFEGFVNTGTSSEYGPKNHAPKETDLLEPNSHYAVTKAAATLLCRHTALSSKVNISTLRLYSVYGPYEEPRRLMPTIIMRGLKGELPALVNPDVARDYVHVDDVCEAYVRAAERSGPEYGAVYNVGTGVQTTIRDVVELAKKAMAIKCEPEWGSMPGRMWDTTVWIADNKKIETEIGWRPNIAFQDGFRKTVEWFKKNPRAWGPAA